MTSFSSTIQALNPTHETKEEAIQKAMNNADHEIKTASFDAIAEISQEQAYIASEDILEYLEQRNYIAHDTRFLGGILREAAKMGWIRKTGNYKPSRRKECHNRPILIWESCIYGKK